MSNSESAVDLRNNLIVKLGYAATPHQHGILWYLYSEGKTEESLKYLVRFVEVSEKSKQDMALANACRNLGYIYNSRVSSLTPTILFLCDAS